MNKQVMVIEYDGEKVKATHYSESKQKSIEMFDFENENDFLYYCAYLIDEMATEKKFEKSFNGYAVCAETKEGSGFSVGEIYRWENGRTVNDYLQIFPIEYNISEKCVVNSIMNVESIKFVVLGSSYENND